MLCRTLFCSLFVHLFVLVTMLSIASSDSLVDKLTLISDLNNWLVLDDQVCKSSTCSNRINLSNSLNNDVCIVFLWYDEIKLNLENLEKKVNTWKEKVWNFTKNNFVHRNFLKTCRQTVTFTTHILNRVSNNKYGYIDIKTTYKGGPKVWNI